MHFVDYLEMNSQVITTRLAWFRDIFWFSRVCNHCSVIEKRDELVRKVLQFNVFKVRTNEIETEKVYKLKLFVNRENWMKILWSVYGGDSQLLLLIKFDSIIVCFIRKINYFWYYELTLRWWMQKRKRKIFASIETHKRIFIVGLTFSHSCLF